MFIYEPTSKCTNLHQSKGQITILKNRKMITRRFEQSAALMRQNFKNYTIFKAHNMQNQCFQFFFTSLPTLSMDKMGLRF